MSKYINGFRYGDLRTRCLLIFMVALLLFGMGSIVPMIISHSPLWGMSAVFSILLFIILTQSFTDKALNPKAHIDIQKITKSQLNKILIQYKVKKEHYPIIIDSWESKKVKQCPAYLWRQKDEMMLLLIEAQPRLIQVPVSEITCITYEKGCTVTPESDYKELKKSPILYMAFSAYLPSVYEENRGIQHLFKKNLYIVTQDLKITNTSIKYFMDLFSISFSISDYIKDPKLKNVYFETAYSYQVLLKDHVLSVPDYKKSVKLLLEKLIEANMSIEKFDEYMNMLVAYHLVTKKYANYYSALKKK